MASVRLQFVAGIVLALALAGVRPAQSAAPLQGPAPVRILIVGDSVSQGSSGDWTWRYRLWKHLVAVGASVDFVGPRTDVFDLMTGSMGSHQYVDQSFDQDHAARWGMSFTDQDHPIGELVASYQPDVVVELLGLNDLVWQGASAQGLEARVTDFVHEAQAADPAVDVVIGQLPQTWFDQVPQFDADLRGLAESLTMEPSRIVAALDSDGFREYVDTYDPAHPTATGEVKIAAAMADALAGLGIGAPYPRPLPDVPNGPRGVATLDGAEGDGYVDLSWIRPSGSDETFVSLRDASAGEDWHRLPNVVSGTTWREVGLVDYDRYQFRVQSAKGTAMAEDLFSNVVTVTPRPPAPEAVTGLQVRPGPHRLQLSWEAPARATSYAVHWARVGAADGAGRSRETSAPSMVLDGLVAGQRYAVTVRALNDRTPGPITSRWATPFGPTVAAPTAPDLRARRHGVLVSWAVVPDATRYEVWHRTLGEPWARAGSTSHAQVVLRVAGRGIHLFRVRAWHQLVPGGVSPVSRLALRK